MPAAKEGIGTLHGAKNRWGAAASLTTPGGRQHYATRCLQQHREESVAHLRRAFSRSRGRFRHRLLPHPDLFPPPVHVLKRLDLISRIFQDFQERGLGRDVAKTVESGSGVCPLITTKPELFSVPIRLTQTPTTCRRGGEPDRDPLSGRNRPTCAVQARIMASRKQTLRLRTSPTVLRE